MTKQTRASVSVSQRLQDLGMTETPEIAYIERVLHPLMVAMTRAVVRSKPTCPAGLLIKFLLDYKGAPTYVINQVSTWLDEQDQNGDASPRDSTAEDKAMADLQNCQVTSRPSAIGTKPLQNSRNSRPSTLTCDSVDNQSVRCDSVQSSPMNGGMSMDLEGMASRDSVALEVDLDDDEGAASLSVAKQGIKQLSKNRSSRMSRDDSEIGHNTGSRHSESDPSGVTSHEMANTTSVRNSICGSQWRTPGGTCLKNAPVRAVDSMCLGFMHKKRLDVSESEKLDLVIKCPLFQGLKNSDQERIARAFEIVHFAENEEIMRHNEPCKGLTLIVNGSARMAVPQDIATLEYGDVAGDNALMRDIPCDYNLTAAGSGGVVALHLPKLACKVLGLKKVLGNKKKKKVKAAAGLNRETKQNTERKKQYARTKSEDSKRKSAIVGGDLHVPEETHVITDEDRKLILDAVKQNENLTDMLQLDASQLEKIVDAVTKQYVPAGQVVVGIGDVDDAFYIVHDGMLEIDGRHDNKFTPALPYRNGQLRAGDTFGELALLYDAPSDYNIRALRNSFIWVLTRDNFRNVMRLKSEKRITDYLDMVKTIPFLSSRLNAEEQEVLADALEEQFFVHHEAIVTEGESGNTFYLIFEGECQIEKGGVVLETMSKGAWFGEKALLEDQPRAATIRAKSDYVVVLTLSRMDFDLLLSPLEDLLLKHSGQGVLKARNSLLGLQQAMAKRNSSIRQSVVAGIQVEKKDPMSIAPLQEALSVQNEPAKFPSRREDLERIGVLGTGSFGYVSLERYAGELFALKALSKVHIVKEGIQSQAQNERACMLMLDSPFVVKLWRTYQDEKSVYFLLEPAFGGELFDVYNNLDLFGSLKHARFYGACVTIGLDHLHGRRIVYRDLKFENCLISTAGYGKLTDFGIAKVVVGKTYTVCGTSDYFAPETLRQIGHNRAVDWWAFGVMLFIAMSGRSPFDAPSVIQIYKNITKGFAKVAIPKEFSAETTGVITALCQKKAEERITMGKRGVKNLQEHAWFEGLDWAAIEALEMESPYKPDVSDDPKELVGKASEDCSFLEYQNEEYIDDGSGWEVDF